MELSIREYRKYLWVIFDGKLIWKQNVEEKLKKVPFTHIKSCWGLHWVYVLSLSIDVTNRYLSQYCSTKPGSQMLLDVLPNDIAVERTAVKSAMILIPLGEFSARTFERSSICRVMEGEIDHMPPWERRKASCVSNYNQWGSIVQENATSHW